MSKVGRLERFSRSLAIGAGIATARFPLAALLIITVAALANLALADIYPIAEDQLLRLAYALYAAASASIALRLHAESHGWRQLPTIGAPLAAGLVAGLAVWNAATLGILSAPLGAALTLLIPLAPYIARPDDARFWSFTLWTVVGMMLAFVSVVLFVTGFSAITEMIRYLFGIGLSNDAYEHIWVTALTLVGPLFALGRIPSDFDAGAATGSDDRMTSSVRILFDWVASPLVLVTAVVLHLYAAKIVLTGELPKNEIGWIVTVYALLVLSLRIAVDPFVEKGAASTRLFARFWAPMLVVPLALLGYAAGLRIGAEGLTYERYYLALGGIAAAVIVTAQLVPRLRGDIRFMAGVPILLLALSSFGPWGVMGSVARSQIGRIEAQLKAGDPATDAERVALRSRIEVLADVERVDLVLPLLTDIQRADVDKRLAEQPGDLKLALVNALGVGYGVQETPSDPAFVFASTQATSLNLSGFDTALPEQSANLAVGVPDSAPGQTQPLALTIGSSLLVRYRGIEDEFPLMNAVDLMKAAQITAAVGVEPVVLDLSSQRSGRKVRVRIVWATIEPKTDCPSLMTLTVLLNHDEWRAKP